MQTTILFADADPRTVEAVADEGRLWLDPAAMEEATGWTLKPEGLCRGDACVPLPGDGSWLDAEGRVELTAFAARARRPVIADEARGVWGFGEPAESRDARATSAQAPDFTLPDLDGTPVSLSDFRGRKVFLLSWGSY